MPSMCRQGSTPVEGSTCDSSQATSARSLFAAERIGEPTSISIAPSGQAATHNPQASQASSSRPRESSFRTHAPRGHTSTHRWQVASGLAAWTHRSGATVGSRCAFGSYRVVFTPCLCSRVETTSPASYQPGPAAAPLTGNGNSAGTLSSRSASSSSRLGRGLSNNAARMSRNSSI